MLFRMISLVIAVTLFYNLSFANVGTLVPNTDAILSPISEASHHYDFDVMDMLKPGKAGYFALSPAHKFIGPVFSEENGPEYIKEVFALLVQAADYMASDYYKVGYNDNYTYWTFLVTALAVPHHESKLMHARRADKDLKDLPMCEAKFNELEGIDSSTMLPILKTIYRRQADPILPNCSVLKKQSWVEQLMISDFNKRDMGLMQLNAPTFKEALMPDVYLNLYNTIRFGMYHLYSKFNDVRSNYAKYPCMTEMNPFPHKDTIPSVLYNVPRGTWCGGYNIGNTLQASVCRFADENNKDHDYDVSFKKHLDSLVIHDSSIFHKYLPKGSTERKALDEIIFNYRSAFTKAREKERHTSVQAMLQTDYFTKYLDEQQHYKKNFVPTHYVNIPTLLLRHAPHLDSKWVCGKIHVSGLKQNKNTPGIPNINVEKVWDYQNPWTNKMEKWAEVRISKYANDIEMTSQEPHCYANDRYTFFVDGNLISEVKSKDLTNTDLFGRVATRPTNPNIREFYSLDSSIMGQVVPETHVNIIEVASERITVKDRKTGDLKPAQTKWYKILIPNGSGKFGWVHEQTFEYVTERQ